MFAIDVDEWDMPDMNQEYRERREPKLRSSCEDLLHEDPLLADIHFSPSLRPYRATMERVRDEADLSIVAGDLTNYGRV